MKILTMKREKVIETLNELPKQFKLEDLLERLVIVEKIEEGLTQLKNGKTITHNKVKEAAKKW
jgi:hypothetical protein